MMYDLTWPLRQHIRQRGDTIVEVLISMLIISVILAGAYGTVNKSSIGVRDSKEHAEALRLAQSQIEALRQDASKTTGSVIFTDAANPPFCLYNGALLPANNASECRQDSGGQPTTTEPVYNLSDVRTSCGPGLPGNCYQFAATVSWNSVTGNGQASEQIVYRLYQ